MSKLITGLSISVLLVAIYFFHSNKHYETLINYLLPHKVEHSTANLYTSEELEQFNGIKQKNLYISILGNIFDVTSGYKHYGPGKTYNIFVGRDASKSFITGKFEKNKLSDDVIDLSNEELRSLNHWVDFYTKQYKYIGKLIGRYYKENGEQTDYNRKIFKLIQEAINEKQQEDTIKNLYPPCNVEWNAEKGTRVWCTDKSGGVQRDWIGFPRKLYEVGSETFRCACIREDSKIKNIELYENCTPESISCYVNT